MSLAPALCHLSRLLQGDAVRWLLTIAAGPQQFEALLPEAAGNRKGKFFDLTQKILKEWQAISDKLLQSSHPHPRGLLMKMHCIGIAVVECHGEVYRSLLRVARDVPSDQESYHKGLSLLNLCQKDLTQNKVQHAFQISHPHKTTIILFNLNLLVFPKVRVLEKSPKSSERSEVWKWNTYRKTDSYLILDLRAFCANLRAFCANLRAFCTPISVRFSYCSTISVRFVLISVRFVFVRHDFSTFSIVQPSFPSNPSFCEIFFAIEPSKIRIPDNLPRHRSYGVVDAKYEDAASIALDW